MKTETPRTDAAISDFRGELLHMFPEIKGDQIAILILMAQLVASSAIIDHLNEQSQRK